MIKGAEKATPVLYLDIDGTVREGKDDPLGRFVNGPGDVRVFPQAVEMMRRWRDKGGRIVGVSNQGGIALGYVTAEQVEAAMVETSRQTGNLFDEMLWCRHAPDGGCWCRKPLPGLLIHAALTLEASYNEVYPPRLGLMVGDRLEDEQCAKAAGLNFAWAADWRDQATTHLPGDADG